MHGHWFGNTAHKNSSSNMRKTKASRKPNRLITHKHFLCTFLVFPDGLGHSSDMPDQLSSVLSPLLTQAFFCPIPKSPTLPHYCGGMADLKLRPTFAIIMLLLVKTKSEKMAAKDPIHSTMSSVKTLIYLKVRRISD